MIRVTEADLPAVRAFLRTRVERAMFPLSNLDRFGLDGTHPYALAMWMTRDGETVTDVLAVTRNGAVMPALGSGDFDAAAAQLAGCGVTALIGPADECRPLADAAGLAGHPTALDSDEPQFALDLEHLSVPAGPGQLERPGNVDRALLLDWRAAYQVETLGTDPDMAQKRATEEIEGYIAADSHRVLVADGTPLAFTGFNARLPDIVQIGGVYTPPALRGRGHARRAVALHLAEARAAGIAKATLFAANDAAVRAYRAIGFTRIGTWTLCLYRETVTARD